MSTVKLAEALLRRKELQLKVDQLHRIQNADLYEVKARRQPVSEGIDDVVVQVPKCEAAQVTAEYDHYAQQLRRCDAAIQRANWETDVEVGDKVMANWSELNNN